MMLGRVYAERIEKAEYMEKEEYMEKVEYMQRMTEAGDGNLNQETGG
jgi:hypothetical protein